jgi:hypothetical protein
MADRKTFLNKNFNVNELKKIFKQIGGTGVTGLKKNQLINKIVSLEKKNFNQTGGFGLNDIVNFFGNDSNNINILKELEPDSDFLYDNFIGGDSDQGDQGDQCDQEDDKKKRRRRPKKQQAQQQQEQENESEGGFMFSDTSLDLDSTISSLNLDSSLDLDSSLNLDDLSATSY